MKNKKYLLSLISAFALTQAPNDLITDLEPNVQRKLSEYLNIAEIQLLQCTSPQIRSEFEPIVSDAISILLDKIKSETLEMIESVNKDIAECELQINFDVTRPIRQDYFLHQMRSRRAKNALAINRTSKTYLEESLEFLQNPRILEYYKDNIVQHIKIFNFCHNLT